MISLKIEAIKGPGNKSVVIVHLTIRSRSVGECRGLMGGGKVGRSGR